MKRKLVLYSEILGDNEKFTPKVILLVIVTIGVVILVSGSLIYSMWSDFNTTEKWLVGASAASIYAIFIWFCIILLSLKFIHKVSSLPSMHQLLDGAITTQVYTSALIAQTMEVEFQVYKDKFYFKFMTTIPVTNVEILLSQIRISLTKNGVVESDLCTYNEETGHEPKSFFITKDLRQQKKFADSINNGVYFVAPLIQAKDSNYFLTAWIGEHIQMDLSFSTEIIVTDQQSHARLIYESVNIFSPYKDERVHDRELMYNGKEIDLKKVFLLSPKEIKVQSTSYDNIKKQREENNKRQLPLF